MADRWDPLKEGADCYLIRSLRGAKKTVKPDVSY